jgi:hypothetical protein
MGQLTGSGGGHQLPRIGDLQLLGGEFDAPAFLDDQRGERDRAVEELAALRPAQGEGEPRGRELEQDVSANVPEGREQDKRQQHRGRQDEPEEREPPARRRFLFPSRRPLPGRADHFQEGRW